ncbi:MAG: hypothetical protein KAR35_02420, partial [Candidatus Heimdallarchaeota archaeon]|nr:hypothetical protein [Candidatus Heimdallarchaeota archaeon]MCK5048209.1 hypothetical protein [Candidatus Heimdallarchaeota archaeon]
MNTENSLPENELYDTIAREARNLLLLILNFTIFVLIVQIYPKLDQTELMISLSVGLSIICSFYFYVVAKEISLKTVLPTNAFLLLNICAASITNDVVWYTSAGIIVFLLVTFVTVRIRIPDEQEIIVTTSFIGAYLAIVIVWYAKINEINADYLWEMVVSQLILAGALFFYLFKKLKMEESTTQLPFLPLLLNVILIPVFFKDNLAILQYQDVESLSLYDKISVYRDDYSLLLFGIFLIIFYLYSIKAKDSALTMNTVISSLFMLFIAVIMLNQYREEYYDFISLGDQIFTLSLIYLLFVGLTIFVAKQELNFNVPAVSTFAIITLSIAVIIEFLVVNYESVSEYPFISPLILTIGISAPLVLLFWIEDETTLDISLFLQTVGVGLFAFLPGQGLWVASERIDSYISIVFILYFSAIAYLAWTNARIRNGFSFYFPALYLWFMIGANIFGNEICEIRIPSFMILVLAILVLTFFTYLAKDSRSSLNFLYSQVFAALILSFYSFKNLLEIEETNVVLNEFFEEMISSFSGGIESPFITICFIAIQVTLLVKWITFSETSTTERKIVSNSIANKIILEKVTRELFAYLSLFFSVAFLIVNLSNELPVINLVISISILVVVVLPLLKSELMPESEVSAYTFFGLSALATFL